MGKPRTRSGEPRKSDSPELGKHGNASSALLLSPQGASPRLRGLGSCSVIEGKRYRGRIADEFHDGVANDTDIPTS
jgi:hypothetical protein